MFIVILIVFGVCWLPYHTYFIYTYYHMVKYESFECSTLPNISRKLMNNVIARPL